MSGVDTPRIILGTMTFGLEGSDAAATTVRVRGSENIKAYLDEFHAHGHVELDTARVYCGGDTEIALGQLPTEPFKIATKVWPTVPKAHALEHLRRTLQESLTALKLKKIDIFYLHAPDYTTSFEETVKAVDELYREGLFERFGLSNFAAWQVALIHQLCKQHGYVLPVVYQGMYNAITRDVVRELFPCLKALNIAFYAYNPIAGGLLSGRYNFDSNDAQDGGRFATKTEVGKIYRERYWNNLFFEAVKKVEKAAKDNNLTLIETALRWMSHHSDLGPQDGIIIGASSMQHLKDNLRDLEKGPLPQHVVEALDEAWEHVRVACPSYFKTAAAAQTVSNVFRKL
ncbi:Aldo/keto reductase [Lobosporangium transversale]|uniref:Aldo/keto reductase n=1 Tax=Lobosporangium transversale TaxID=64571 RepID=A0A1Y2GFH7_9FUNG|nr:Aldo/keto reductase [Lobosporangium transversale]ORZ09371.1 Aldo/keto reductase [Lobosporangium transversale]|eukprot:XP_021878824.1 Aldo/keto reductase [Lobosporangium transversale]